MGQKKFLKRGLQKVRFRIKPYEAYCSGLFRAYIFEPPEKRIFYNAMKERHRMVIYTKDVQRITGRTDRYARKIMSKIRVKYGKQKHQLISLTELCEYMGLNVEDVAKYLD